MIRTFKQPRSSKHKEGVPITLEVCEEGPIAGCARYDASPSWQRYAATGGIALFKAITAIKLSPAVWQELRKALAAKNPASWRFCSSRGLYSANPCFVFVFRPWQEKVFLSRRTLHLLTGVGSAEFLQGTGAERTVCVQGGGGQPNSSSTEA